MIDSGKYTGIWKPNRRYKQVYIILSKNEQMGNQNMVINNKIEHHTVIPRWREYQPANELANDISIKDFFLPAPKPGFENCCCCNDCLGWWY